MRRQKEEERKSIYIAPFIYFVSKRSGMDHTVLFNHPLLQFTDITDTFLSTAARFYSYRIQP